MGLGFIFLAGSFAIPFLIPSESAKFLSETTTPFLSISSFLIVVAAVLMQKNELELQRKEIKETRKEFKQQNDTLSHQRFEHTFFNMISLHNDIVENIAVPISTHRESGRRSIVIIYNKFKKNCTEDIRKQGVDAVVQKYCYIFNAYQAEIGHYFRNLYRIIKFIDETTDIDHEEKSNYIGIIKAQLSSYELVLLFYNCLSKYGNEKFLPLIRKYNLLDNINPELLIEKDHMEQIIN